MYKAFLIKYAEIGVKGNNKRVFEDALVNEVKRALKKYPKINTRYASIDDLSKYLMPILANKQKKCKLSKWIESDYAKKVGRYKKDSKGKYYKLK